MKIDCESIFREDLFLYNCLQIPSAVAFLTGAFPAAQPRGFAPYVVCDPVVGSYQVRFHFSLFSASYSKDRIYVYIPILFDSVRSPWINNLCRPTVERRRWARLGCGPDGADAVVVRPAGPVQGRHHHFHFGRRCLRSRLSRARVAEQRPRPRFLLGPGMMMPFSAGNLDMMIELSSPYCPASLAIGEIPTIGYKVKTSRRTQCAE